MFLLILKSPHEILLEFSLWFLSTIKNKSLHYHSDFELNVLTFRKFRFFINIILKCSHTIILITKKEKILKMRIVTFFRQEKESVSFFSTWYFYVQILYRKIAIFMFQTKVYCFFTSYIYPPLSVQGILLFNFLLFCLLCFCLLCYLCYHIIN